MGWLWFIPTFHMSQEEPTTKFVLTRKEIDFPLGIGSGIIDVEIALEWLKDTDAEVVQPPARMGSEEEKAHGMEAEPSGLAATVQAITAPNLGEAHEAKQAAED